MAPEKMVRIKFNKLKLKNLAKFFKKIYEQSYILNVLILKYLCKFERIEIMKFNLPDIQIENLKNI